LMDHLTESIANLDLPRLIEALDKSDYILIYKNSTSP
jgi:hypothetical protein